MGLTIHYSIRSRSKSESKVAKHIEAMRQLALDLPFEDVDGRIIDLAGEDADFENPRYTGPPEEIGEELPGVRWMLIQASQSVTCPWNRRISRLVKPSRAIAFTAWPGHGCEPMNIGLCRFPAEIEWDYRPADDARFHYTEAQKKKLRDKGRWQIFDSTFDWRKWERNRQKHGMTQWSPDAVTETRQVRTRLSGWHWASFCKTQYASDPRCGGVPNFLKCHIAAVTLLDRIAELPTVSVQIDDEGKYGPSHYTDDWAVPEPVYTWHEGRYDPKALAEEVGSWNEMIAGMVGALNDALDGSGVEGEAPITQFSNFEHLEFRGSRDESIKPFLEAMEQLAEQERTKHPNGDAA